MSQFIEEEFQGSEPKPLAPYSNRATAAQPYSPPDMTNYAMSDVEKALFLDGHRSGWRDAIRKQPIACAGLDALIPFRVGFTWTVQQGWSTKPRDNGEFVKWSDVKAWAAPVQPHSGNPASTPAGNTGREPIGYVSQEQLEWLARSISTSASVSLWRAKAPLDAVPVFVAPVAARELDADAERLFDEFWKLEVANNGGVGFGADYKHWARKGFFAARTAAQATAPAPAKFDEGKLMDLVRDFAAVVYGQKRTTEDVGGKLVEYVKSVAAQGTQAGSAPEGEIPAHLREFVQEIATDYTYYDSQESVHCGGCCADLGDDEPHNPDCIVLRAKALLAPTSDNSPVGGKD